MAASTPIHGRPQPGKIVSLDDIKQMESNVKHTFKQKKFRALTSMLRSATKLIREPGHEEVACRSVLKVDDGVRYGGAGAILEKIEKGYFLMNGKLPKAQKYKTVDTQAQAVDMVEPPAVEVLTPDSPTPTSVISLQQCT